MIFFKTFPDCFLQNSDPKSAIKNIDHHARLGDIIASSYPLNPCNFTYQDLSCLFLQFTLRQFRRSGKHSFKVILKNNKISV